MPAHAIVLGTAQDGGVPQIRCPCDHCGRARGNRAFARRVGCLGLSLPDGRSYLVDATPDMPRQAEAVATLDGIFLTHAHMGHVAGLLWLGREALAARKMPVWAGPRLTAHLERNEPWASLVTDGRIELRPLRAGESENLASGLCVTPIAVPHRAEWSETFAFLIRGTRRGLLYAPDIDAWTAGSLAALLGDADAALLDGTFFSGDELKGRDIAEVPHPPVRETLRLLEAIRPRAAVSFTHLNHTNPLLDPRSMASAEVARRYRAAGLRPAFGRPVPREGARLAL